MYQHLRGQAKDVYYFEGKQETDFVCKEGLKIKELINVCHNLEDKETYLREVSALKEAMDYFKLKQAKIITAEGQKRDIKADNFHVSVIPFYQWALE